MSPNVAGTPDRPAFAAFHHHQNNGGPAPVAIGGDQSAQRRGNSTVKLYIKNSRHPFSAGRATGAAFDIFLLLQLQRNSRRKFLKEANHRFLPD